MNYRFLCSDTAGSHWSIHVPVMHGDIQSCSVHIYNAMRWAVSYNYANNYA